MKPSKIGITGANGVLGRTIMSNYPNENWIVFEDDVCSVSDLELWYRLNYPFDAIIHFAAIVPTFKVEKNPIAAFRVNVGGTINLLDIVHRQSAESLKPWIFLASSSHVYRSNSKPISENFLTEPITIYGTTKLQAEQWCEVYRAHCDLTICTGRIFSFTSPYQEKSYFIPAIIEKISLAPYGKSLHISGLMGIRDFISTGQICSAIYFLFRKRSQGTFNIGSGKATPLLDVAEAIKKRLDRNDLKIIPKKEGTNLIYADISKLKELGWLPKYELEELLDEMIC